MAYVLAEVHNKNIAPKIERLLPIITVSFFIPALIFLVQVAHRNDSCAIFVRLRHVASSFLPAPAARQAKFAAVN